MQSQLKRSRVQDPSTFYQQPPLPLYQPFDIVKTDNPALTTPVQYLKFYPTCTDIMFMLPFPFFCMGCYCSRTARLEFNHSRKMLIYKGNRGFCFCCAQTHQIPYGKVEGVNMQMDRQVKINKQPSYVVSLSTEYKNLPITGNVMSSDANQVSRELNHFIEKIRMIG